MNQISEDTKIVLMLCGTLPGAPVCDGAPLSAGEFYRLMRWLDRERISMAALPEEQTIAVLEEGMPEHQMPVERLRALLGRGTAMAIACERWLQMGLWIVSPCDQSYPRRLKKRLGDKASPLLFGAGERSLLEGGGLAVVGSRNADEAAQEFSLLAGTRAAQQRVPVISGGARGVDLLSMQGALEAGGKAAGVLANNLARDAASPETRGFIESGQLTLLTPVAPEAHFHAGNAMARNKYIYALADAALVVSSDYGSGGTWAGAQENLKYAWCPLFVRDDEDVPEGNRRLLQRGAAAITKDVLDSCEDLLVWFEAHAPRKPANEQESLFGNSDES